MPKGQSAVDGHRVAGNLQPAGAVECVTGPEGRAAVTIDGARSCPPRWLGCLGVVVAPEYRAPRSWDDDQCLRFGSGSGHRLFSLWPSASELGSSWRLAMGSRTSWESRPRLRRGEASASGSENEARKGAPTRKADLHSSGPANPKEAESIIIGHLYWCSTRGDSRDPAAVSVAC